MPVFSPVGDAVSEELPVDGGGVRGPPAHPDRGRGEVVRRGDLRPPARSCKGTTLNDASPSCTARFLNARPDEMTRTARG